MSIRVREKGVIGFVLSFLIILILVILGVHCLASNKEQVSDIVRMIFLWIQKHTGY